MNLSEKNKIVFEINIITLEKILKLLKNMNILVRFRGIMNLKNFLPRIWYHIDKIKSRHYRYSPNQIKNRGYFSQYGQDIIVSEHFKKNKGFFLDIGAHDGISLNNTYYFEKVLNWEGIAFEPNPEVYKRLIKNRKCECINACISEKSGEIEFLLINGYSEMLSGIQSKYNSSHMKRIKREIKIHGGEIKKIFTSCCRVNEILNARKIKNVDIISIDTEGGEFEIINSIDFSKINFKAIVIENNYSDYRIWQKLINEDFYLFALAGSDEIYFKRGI